MFVERDLQTGKEARRKSNQFINRKHHGLGQLEIDPMKQIFASYNKGYFGPVVMFDVETLLPEWFCMEIDESLGAAFTAAGQMIEPTREQAAHFGWIVERKDGALDVLTRDEFLEEMALE